ncbi:SET domain-containing protein [bacterium BMS3Abin03]|nr:SET domain-containing protein [bacterium BMS3Abin03]MCG6959175.1 SET domain-containing protein [bacterium BMS3Abin03]
MENLDYEEFVFVEESDIHGKGIFISTDIPRGKKILSIKGELIDGNECMRREDEEDNVYIFWNYEDMYIDTAMTDKIKYINHNCDFNCDIVDEKKNGLKLIAYKDIKAGEELTIDYGYEDIYEECSCNLCINEIE